MKKQNLKKISNSLKGYFYPRIIGEVNDVFVKVVKIKGDKIPWHKHEKEDELFYIIEGSLLFEIEKQESFIMNEGDVFIVKQGVNHRVSSKKECKIMLIENKTAKHTGEIKTDITKTIKEQLL